MVEPARSRKVGWASLVCNAVGGGGHLTVVTALAVERADRQAGGLRGLAFEVVYRENVGRVSAFFARRCRDPQLVPDLTSQTSVEAIKSAATFEGRGSEAGWLLAIARRVYANHLAELAAGADLIELLAGSVVADEDELEDLAARIDAQRDGRRLLERASRLPPLSGKRLSWAIWLLPVRRP